MVRHLAAKYDLDIDIIDMNSGNMNNNALMQSVNMAAGILLFEDIDNVDAAIGVKKDLEKDARKVTLDGLLNALDGVQRGASKLIIIATTNDPEKLVPSLRRRGRLGVSFEISYPSDGVVTRLVRHALPRCDAPAAVSAMRQIEARVGIRAPTAALTDVFGKAGLRLRYPPNRPPLATAPAVGGDEPSAHEAEALTALAQVWHVHMPMSMPMSHVRAHAHRHVHVHVHPLMRTARARALTPRWRRCWSRWRRRTRRCSARSTSCSSS